MSLFARPLPTREQKVATSIDTQLRSAAVTMLTAYQQVRTLIYSNPAFTDEYGTCDSDAIYEAFVANTTTGLTAEQLGAAARVTKTFVNTFAPGTINDAVPEVGLTF